jgi:uncharacterized membrane protein
MFSIPVVVVAIFFIGAGILHFVLLDFFSSIVPPYFTNPEALVKISGVFEILGGIGILIERTRQWAAYGLIALCVAVLPANIHMAMHGSICRYSRGSPVFALALAGFGDLGHLEGRSKQALPKIE